MEKKYYLMNAYKVDNYFTGKCFNTCMFCLLLPAFPLFLFFFVFAEYYVGRPMCELVSRYIGTQTDVALVHTKTTETHIYFVLLWSFVFILTPRKIACLGKCTPNQSLFKHLGLIPYKWYTDYSYLFKIRMSFI